MSHSHSHSRSSSPGRHALGQVLALTFLFFLVELVGGLWANSLALVSDAVHMVSDVSSLGLSWLAMWLSRRPAPPQKTFGYRRVEILAALLNGFMLLLVTGFVFREAWERFLNPPPVRSGFMLVVALVGLLANLAGILLLRRDDPRANLNVKSAYLHVLGDLLGSVGAVTAGVVIALTGWYAVDAVVSVVIGLIILLGTIRLLREVGNVLLEATPDEVDLSDVRGAILATEGVKGVHDLHVWTITSGILSLMAHVVVDGSRPAGEILTDILYRSRESFGIDHVTVQLEREEYPCPGCVAQADSASPAASPTAPERPCRPPLRNGLE